MVILSLGELLVARIFSGTEETYLAWYMHHAATIPLVAALAPRDVMPR
jgi:hypothetical protein